MHKKLKTLIESVSKYNLIAWTCKTMYVYSQKNNATSFTSRYNKFANKIPNERGANDEHTIRYVVTTLL